MSDIVTDTGDTTLSASVDSQEVAEVNSPLRLPFKRNGIVIDPVTSTPCKVLCLKKVKPVVLAEVRRFLNTPLHFEAVDESFFKEKLAQAYENSSDEAIQMVEGLGDDMDLASLADAVPETEDLLEQEEDAPIIRLINALLTEAIKVGASDIHVETFEKRLVIRFRVDGVLRNGAT